MADDKLVEIMRDAIERTLLRWLFVGQSADYMFSASDALARAALAAIEAAGWRVVPGEPTEAMWRAWISVNHDYDPVTQHAYFHGDIGNWRACWDAALAAMSPQARPET